MWYKEGIIKKFTTDFSMLLHSYVVNHPTYCEIIKQGHNRYEKNPKPGIKHATSIQ